MEADIIAKEIESPFSVLTSDRFSLSALRLLVCDGGCGRGINFSKACAQVDYIYHSTPAGRAKPQIHAFTEIFPTGSAVLMEFIVSRTRTDPALNTLLSFIPQIEEASARLQSDTEEEASGKSETEWSARLAVHLFTPLSQSHDYILDNQSARKTAKCPCSCNRLLNYGNTSIGNPKTWCGRFDILIGNNISPDVGATVLHAELVDETPSDDESLAEDLSQIEVMSDELQKNLSQLISETVVFSFYQKKQFPSLSLVPSIGVSKSHIQFHFYDADKDVYFISQEMPLFYKDKSLHLTTVLAIWLVLNYRCFLSEATEEMTSEGKFGFHAQVSETLHLYKHKIELGMSSIKPQTFHLDVLEDNYDSNNRVTQSIMAKYHKK
ncbi:uncharacterized protein LOC111118743 [Crassostrea virginica]